MHYFLLVSGILILLLVISDIINTTLTPHGGGKMTLFLSRFSWKIFLYFSRNYGGRKILNISGTLIISEIIIMWIFFLWIGFFLVFSFDPHSVVDSSTGFRANLIDKFYFIGYTLSTLGYGDFHGGTPFWRIISSIISFSGLILITIAITYLVPVNSSEISKRKLSTYISTLGSSPQDILLNAWNGRDFKDLNNHFQVLTEMILDNAQNNLAYPILYYFHTSNKAEANPVNLSSLDEALTILICYIPEDIRPDSSIMLPLRKSISAYLNTLKMAEITPAKEMPNLPDISILTRRNIPLLAKEQFSDDFEHLQKRRKILRALLRYDGWEWHDMVSNKYYHDFIV